MIRYAIGLGSNLGDRLGHLTDACRALEERLGPLELSSLYETQPVGGPEQGPFLNAVAVVETELGPEQVLEVLQRIEIDQKRERAVHWGPRTLDLDILAGPAVTTERLTVPHPRAVDREFVLRPLAEVWPDATVGEKTTASEALAAVDSQGVDRLASDWRPPVSRSRAHGLLVAQFALITIFGVVVVVDGSWPTMIGPWAIGGAVMVAIGAIALLWASISLGSAMTASPLPKDGAPLVVAGPYRYARHPIYGGLILFLGGCAFFLSSVAALAVAVLLQFLLLVKARFEEGQLRMRHHEYRSYIETVPYRFIPYVL